MPIIYRHVVPIVPDLPAGNGSIVHRDGSVVYRRKVKFRVVFDWSPDFISSAWWDARVAGEPGFSQWAGPAPSAEQIAEALNMPRAGYDYDTTESFYNAPALGYAGGVAHYATTGSTSYSVPASAGSVWPNSWSINVSGNLYLDWAATNAFWRWRFAVRVQGIRRWYDGSSPGSSSAIFGSIEFASAQLVDDIRPGAAGIALAPPASDPYGFHAVGATIYSEYAP